MGLRDRALLWSSYPTHAPAEQPPAEASDESDKVGKELARCCWETSQSLKVYGWAPPCGSQAMLNCKGDDSRLLKCQQLLMLEGPKT